MYRVAVCDDNEEDGRLLLELTEQILEERKIEAEVSLFRSPEELLAGSGSPYSRYDLFLLDVLMGETSGIALGEMLRAHGSRGKLIYVTSSRDYAIDGYKVQASDYLLKPISRQALDAAIGRVLKRQDTVLVEVDGSLQMVRVEDIQYAEANGHYVTLQMGGTGEPIRLRATLTEVQGRLGERFARCHKGYVVNLGQVREIRVNHILLRSGAVIPLGRKYRCELQRDMVEYVEKAVPLL